jgi:hypothetical protein
MQDESAKKTTRSLGTRLFAFGALAGFISAVGWAGHQAYRAATDSFVAPIILSPDSDIVLAQKLKLAELAVERARATGQLEAAELDIAATTKGIERLRMLSSSTSNALAWNKALTSQQAAFGAVERKTLAKQEGTLKTLLDQQQKVTNQAKSNMEAGLISKMDYAREEQALGRWQVALIETERTKVQTDLLLGQVAMSQRSLAGGSAIATPEQITREEQMVRMELEILKLESEQRARAAEKKVLEEKLAKIDELEGQLKARPIFRAVEQKIEVAFVPYTQLDGAKEGNEVYDCVWGLFACKPVGSLSELVPGEVILPDPWGNQARGQYIVLDLADHSAARSKTLRVRPNTVAANSKPNAQPVAKK